MNFIKPRPYFRVLLERFILFISITVVSTIQAQTLSFHHLTTDNGVSIGFVFCMYQDSRGFMWFGGDGGLIRFDGINCKNYSANPKDPNSLKGIRIMKILEDKNGNLWIATDAALNCYHRNSDNFSSYTAAGLSTNNNFSNRSMAWMNDSTLVLMNELQHFTFNIHTKKLHPSSSDEYENALLHHANLEGNHFVALPSDSCPGLKILYFDHNGNIKHKTFFCNCNPDQEFPAWHDSLIWLVVHDSLVAFNPRTERYFRYAPAHHGTLLSFAILALKGDQLWLSTNYSLSLFDGLLLFDLRKRKFISKYENDPGNAKSISDNSIADGFVDPQNNLWIHAWAKSIDYASLCQNKFIPYLGNLQNDAQGKDNFIRTIVQNSLGNVWMSTLTGKIYELNKQKQIVAIYSKDADGKAFYGINQLFIRDTHQLFVAAASGLYSFDERKKNFFSVIKQHSFQKLPGNIFSLNDGSLVCFADDFNTFKLIRHENFFVPKLVAIKHCPGGRNVMFQDKQGKIYIADPGLSLNIYNAIDDSVPVHTLNIHAETKCFYETDTILWIATTQGLMKLNKNDFSYSMITTTEGLPNNFVYAVLPDRHGDLWLSTNNGLCKFNPQEFSFKNYSVKDGLQSDEFNTNAYMLCPDGEMWFGGINGFNAFYPEQIKDDSTLPQIQITGVEVNDEPYHDSLYIGERRSLSLPYDKRTISFNFTGIEYADEDRVKLEYKMDGVDPKWLETKNPGFARYANLSPGKYIFMVRASNSDGILNPVYKTLQLMIATPFFMTVWFYLLLAIAVAAILVALYRYRIAQIVRLQSVRNRIARDLHDDVGSALGSISYFSQLAKRMNTTNDPELHKLLERIEQLSRNTVENMSDIVWAVNPENDSIAKLVLRMKNFAGDMLHAKNIAFSFETENLNQQEKLSIEARKNIFLIYKEAIYNIAKYSDCTLVKLEIIKTDGQLKLMIEDNGKGFDCGHVHAYNGNGLVNMKKRAEELHGKFLIDSKEGRGTRIVVEVRGEQ
jgi:signal transduction histidine kinase/ligand-binding sensor domain-containing protein